MVVKFKLFFRYLLVNKNVDYDMVLKNGFYGKDKCNGKCFINIFVFFYNYLIIIE